jgi:hypothetical protein
LEPSGSLTKNIKITGEGKDSKAVNISKLMLSAGVASLSLAGSRILVFGV